MRVVTGEAKGRKLKAPKTMGTRPIIDRVFSARSRRAAKAWHPTSVNFAIGSKQISQLAVRFECDNDGLR